MKKPAGGMLAPLSSEPEQKSVNEIDEQLKELESPNKDASEDYIDDFDDDIQEDLPNDSDPEDKFTNDNPAS